MRNEAVISLTDANCSTNTAVLQRGPIHRIRMTQGRASMVISDKLRQLMQRAVGTRETAVEFTSDTFISDVAYTLVTCYGGFDGTSSTANPDIDWDAFSSWHADAVDNSVLVRAHFDGQKVNECLEILADMYDTAIYLTNDKLVFARFGFDQTNTDYPVNTAYGRIDVEMDDEHMTNRMTVLANKSTGTSSFNAHVTAINTASVNSYGPRDDIWESNVIWYSNSVSAAVQAQRVVAVLGRLEPVVTAQLPFTHLPPSVGSTITVSDAQTGVAGNYRIMRKTIRMQDAKVDLEMERTRLFTNFILDLSRLDGQDLLG